jgi:predicted Zn finger-like uncharacterized protein
MRIVCPSCSVAYDVPDSLLTAGRTTRCARCGGEWVPVQAAAVEPDPAPAPAGDPPQPAGDASTATAAPEGRVSDNPPVAEAPAPRSSATDRLALRSARPPSRLRVRLAWLLSLALLGFLGWAAYAWRAEVVEAWPPSARVYDAFGMRAVPDRTQ